MPEPFRFKRPRRWPLLRAGTQIPRETRSLTILVASQVSINVMPRSGEACENLPRMGQEAKNLANRFGTPVVLLIEGQSSIDFLPDGWSKAKQQSSPTQRPK